MQASSQVARGEQRNVEKGDRGVRPSRLGIAAFLRFARQSCPSGKDVGGRRRATTEERQPVAGGALHRDQAATTGWRQPVGESTAVTAAVTAAAAAASLSFAGFQRARRSKVSWGKAQTGGSPAPASHIASHPGVSAHAHT